MNYTIRRKKEKKIEKKKGKKDEQGQIGLWKRLKNVKEGERG